MPNKPPRSRGSGLTLVELLVVIGVIALLISILMPALARARRQANAVKCAAHLRQIGLVISLYVADNKGFLPIGSDHRVVRPTPSPQYAWTAKIGAFWYEFLTPYVNRNTQWAEQLLPERQRSIFWGCPEWEPREDSSGLDPLDTGYVYNIFPQRPFGDKNFDAMEFTNFHGRYYKLIEIRDPVNRLEVADGSGTLLGSLGWRPPDDRSESLDSPWNYPMDLRRHGARSWSDSNGPNILFFDGHVSRLNPADAVDAFEDPPQ